MTRLGLSSAELADDLLLRDGVACLPGTAFDKHGEGYLRLSYVAGRAELEAALKAIAAYVDGRAAAGP